MTLQFTTLVPAYKPKYLIELLTALRHQTVKPARVIVSDDSPDQAFVALLGSDPIRTAIADLNVVAVPGPRNGAYNNFRALMQAYGGRTALFHLLLDDDIPYPTFYERHLAAHATGQVRCVVSRRWTALESGQPLRDLPLPAAIAGHAQRLLSLSADVLWGHTAGMSSNWLGEFSNATFAASTATELDDPSLGGIRYTGLEDLGAFLKTSLHAPLGFINEHLGFFRTSAEQHSANPMGRPMKLAHLAYIALALAGRRLGQLTPQRAAVCLAGLCPVISLRYGQQADMRELCALMPALAQADADAEAQFVTLWHRYSHSAEREPASAAVPVPA